MSLAKVPSGNTLSAPSLAGALLLAGLAFAWPWALDSTDRGGRPSEVLNVALVTAWLGLAHFYFAYRGHLSTLSRSPRALGPYIALLAAGLAGLLGLRATVGPGVFNALMWVWFVPHFLRAESHFNRTRGPEALRDRDTLLPLLSFAFFSFTLLGPAGIASSPEALLGGLAACGLAGLLSGIHRRWREPGVSAAALISSFLVGEALIWGKYRPFMTEGFRDGVYTIHVALASFYHYFRSYAYAFGSGAVSIRSAVAANLALVAAGAVFVSISPLPEGRFLLASEWFTVWVGLHLWMSHLFGPLKRVLAARP